MVGSSATPLTIMGASTVAWWRSDLGITLNGGTVSAWADQSGNAFDLSQGTAASQPTYNATGGPNSMPSLLFDGSDDWLRNADLDRPAPNVTPTFVWAVLRQVTWSVNDRLWCFGTGNLGMVVVGTTSTPTQSMANTTVANANGGLTVNTYKRVEAYFSGSTDDYLKIGSTSSTGTSAGTVEPAAQFTLGARGDTAGNPANMEITDIAIFSALPSAGQLAALDDYAVGRYGAVT